MTSIECSYPIVKIEMFVLFLEIRFEMRSKNMISEQHHIHVICQERDSLFNQVYIWLSNLVAKVFVQSNFTLWQGRWQRTGWGCGGGVRGGGGQFSKSFVVRIKVSRFSCLSIQDAKQMRHSMGF